MSPLTKFLYRTMRSNCRAIFLPRNRKFLQSSLDSCHESLMLLSRGYPILKSFAVNPQLELERAFREGNEDDVQVLFSILPSLLRYCRAARLIEEHLHEVKALKRNRSRSIDVLDDSRMLSGAILISKLFYNEKELQRRSIDKLVRNGVEELSAALKVELEKTLLERQKLEQALGVSNVPKITLHEKRRSTHILALLNALNTVILRQEARRRKVINGRREHLVDQIILPDETYGSAMPITYSVLYSTVINSMPHHLNLLAVGIPFPQWFLSRIVVKDDRRKHSFSIEEFIKSGPAQFSRRRDLQNVPKEINFMDLLGNWVGFYSEGMKEVRISYDKATRVLEAVRLDGDEFLPAGEVAWSIDLSPICRTSNFLAMNTPYNVSVQVAEKGHQNPYFAWYTLELIVLPASIFQPVSLNNLDTREEAPYFEIQLTPVDLETIAPGHGFSFDHNNYNIDEINDVDDVKGSNGEVFGTSTVRTVSQKDKHKGRARFVPRQIARPHGPNATSAEPALVPHHESSVDDDTDSDSDEAPTRVTAMMNSLPSLVFCRTEDLDRCLLDFSDKGVIPLTPSTYLSFMNDNGRGADRLPDILRPATSNVVTSRMAANLANQYSGTVNQRLQGTVTADQEADAAFWTAVRRFFDEKINRSGM